MNNFSLKKKKQMNNFISLSSDKILPNFDKEKKNFLQTFKIVLNFEV